MAPDERYSPPGAAARAAPALDVPLPEDDGEFRSANGTAAGEIWWRERRSEARICPGSARTPGRYELLDPPTSPEEEALLERWRQRLRPLLPADGAVRRTEDRVRLFGETLERVLPSSAVSADRTGALARVRRRLLQEALGYGSLDPFLTDDDLEEVSIAGVGAPIYVTHRRWGTLEVNRSFRTADEIRRAIRRLAERSGVSLGGGHPMADGVTPEGHRFHAVLSRAVGPDGPTLSIRRARARPFTPEELAAGGTASPLLLAYLSLAVETRASMAVIGGPGAGKTSTLTAIAHLVPNDLKIVSIEEVRELRLPHDHHLPLLVRPGVGRDRRGEVTVYDLVRLALRQRPDRILLGEIRGREAFAVFQAMGTGHPTYATFHAANVEALVRRLSSPPLSIPRSLLRALRIVVEVDVVATERGRERRIRSVTELVPDPEEGEELGAQTVFRWDAARDGFEGPRVSFVLEEWARDHAVDTTTVDRELRRRAERWARGIREPRPANAVARQAESLRATEGA